MMQVKDICDKGHQMELEMMEVREDEKVEDSPILCWLIFGRCHECLRIIVQGMHRGEKKPQEFLDFRIFHEALSKKEIKKDLDI